MRPNKLNQFLWFVTERQRIYQRRFIKDELPPWTDNTILRNYHFCHVYRECDAATRYLRQYILSEDDGVDVLFNVIVFRLVNRPESFEAMGGVTPAMDFDTDEAVARLCEFGKRNPVFSPAYRIPAHRFVDSDSKVENVLYGIVRDDLLPNLSEYADQVLEADTMETAHAALTELRGIGDFIGYELVIDLNYELLPFHENDFVNVGPGARAGLDRIWGDIDDYEGKIRWIVEEQEALFDEYDLDFYYWNGEREKRLSCRDIEHSMCEWNKHQRVKSGDGHTRRFNPRTQFTFDDY